METITNSVTESLRKDHIAVLAELARLREAGDKLTSGSDAEVGAAKQTIGEVAAFLHKELEIHLRKEEEALFPALEAVIGSQGGPTVVMRYEHVDMRADSQALWELSADPAKGLGTPDDAEKTRQNIQKIQNTIAHIYDLLTQHIHKEDFILFNMADDMLSPGAVHTVLAKSQEIDAAA